MRIFPNLSPKFNFSHDDCDIHINTYVFFAQKERHTRSSVLSYSVHDRARPPKEVFLSHTQALPSELRQLNLTHAPDLGVVNSRAVIAFRNSAGLSPMVYTSIQVFDAHEDAQRVGHTFKNVALVSDPGDKLLRTAHHLLTKTHPLSRALSWQNMARAKHRALIMGTCLGVVAALCKSFVAVAWAVGGLCALAWSTRALGPTDITSVACGLALVALALSLSGASLALSSSLVWKMAAACAAAFVMGLGVAVASVYRCAQIASDTARQHLQAWCFALDEVQRHQYTYLQQVPKFVAAPGAPDLFSAQSLGHEACTQMRQAISDVQP